MYVEELMMLLRMIIAGVCGIIIGMERKNRSKEAGIRTHFVVACGAAILMIVSKYAFFDVIKGNTFAGIDVRLDPSRVASTIASGIGFLGAGIIFVHKGSIKGLTTAAGIWATSGVGMAIGAGLYVLGIGATAIILVAQFVLHIDLHRGRNIKTKILNIESVEKTNYQNYITQKLAEWDVSVLNVAVEGMADGTRNYVLKLDISDKVNEDMIIDMIEYKSSIKTSV